MKDIENIYLPKGSENENLETLSRKKFLNLFDDRFIIKDEIIDNGVDFRGEICIKNNKIGFGFTFQLKSKIKADKNSDGTYSKSIETSNIEYLINNGQPAFYGFYIKEEDQFYYEHLNSFINFLDKKSPDWEDQPSHTLKFHKKLDTKAVDNIYNTALEHGKLIRDLTYKFSVNSYDHNDKILIDTNNKVTDDQEIRTKIEEYGFYLINEARWNEVIVLHNKASVNVSVTSEYNLIVGLAKYYTGELLEALSFFKSAIKLIKELPEDLRSLLDYFNISTKYAIGLVDKDEYRKNISVLKAEDNIKFYIKLEQAKEIITSPSETEIDLKYEEYFQELIKIINDKASSKNVKVLARSELMLYEGHKFNLDIFTSIANINAVEELYGVQPELRIQLAIDNIKLRKDWDTKVKNLKEDIIAEGSSFSYYAFFYNDVKVHYELTVYTSLVKIVKPFPGEPDVEKLIDLEELHKGLEVLDKVYHYFNSIQHQENIIAVLSLQYEIEHFLEKHEKANNILSQLEVVIELSDSKEHKRKFDFLKNRGTKHELLKDFLDNIFSKNEKRKLQYEHIRKEFDLAAKEMETLDLAEQSLNIFYKEKHTIELFPIGYFQVPMNSIDDALDILNLEEEARKKVINMFEHRFVPVVNIYCNPIPAEGYEKGEEEFKGLASIENMFRIRKAFFEKRFIRADIVR